MNWCKIFKGYHIGLLLIACMGGYLYHRMSNHSTPKIFQIGMNKCGTRTLCHFFQANGIPSIHNRSNKECPVGELAESISEQYENNKPLISPKYRHVVFFSDMESVRGTKPIYIAEELFRELYFQYPDSKFILNTRNKQDWLQSRVNHKEGEYLRYLMQVYNLTREELLEKWSQDWDEQHRVVQEFFADKPGQLLIFNIDSDGPEKLVDFFTPYYALDPKYYKHLGKTKV